MLLRNIWKHKKYVENIPSFQTDFCFRKHTTSIFENYYERIVWPKQALIHSLLFTYSTSK